MHGGDGSTPAGCLDIFVKHLESESGILSRRTCPVQLSGGTNEDTHFARRDPFFGPGCKPLTDGLDFVFRAIENQDVRLRSVEQGNGAFASLRDAIHVRNPKSEGSPKPEIRTR